MLRDLVGMFSMGCDYVLNNFNTMHLADRVVHDLSFYSSFPVGRHKVAFVLFQTCEFLTTLVAAEAVSFISSSSFSGNLVHSYSFSRKYRAENHFFRNANLVRGYSPLERIRKENPLRTSSLYRPG